jgi:RNA recognition motif-containing protein
VKHEEDLLNTIHVIEGIEVLCQRLESGGSISERKLFIKYLDKKATVKDIEEGLAAYGEIESIHLSMKKDKSLNLGLCNVLFKHKDSVDIVLNEPCVFIKNKKVKVEPFKCGIAPSGPNGPYFASTFSQCKSAHHNWTDPQLHNLSEHSVSASKYRTSQVKGKATKSVVEMLWGLDASQGEERFMQPIPLLRRESSKKTMTKGTRDSKDQLETSSKVGDSKVLHNRIKSIDFSSIEEVCEDSPRQRRNSETLQHSCRPLGGNLKEIERESPIISIHGGIQENMRRQTPEKMSYHSVKPTTKIYFKNPRHHQVGISKNHAPANLRFKKRICCTNRAPLPGAFSVIPYRLF